jgi:hypothetical protein
MTIKWTSRYVSASRRGGIDLASTYLSQKYQISFEAWQKISRQTHAVHAAFEMRNFNHSQFRATAYRDHISAGIDARHVGPGPSGLHPIPGTGREDCGRSLGSTAYSGFPELRRSDISIPVATLVVVSAEGCVGTGATCLVEISGWVIETSRFSQGLGRETARPPTPGFPWLSAFAKAAKASVWRVFPVRSPGRCSRTRHDRTTTAAQKQDQCEDPKPTATETSSDGCRAQTMMTYTAFSFKSFR